MGEKLKIISNETFRTEMTQEETLKIETLKQNMELKKLKPSKNEADKVERELEIITLLQELEVI